MRRILRRAALAAVALLVAVLPAGAAPVSITLMQLSDSHGSLDRQGPRDAALQARWGGVAKAATAIGAVRAADPNALLFHAGDAFHGDFLFQYSFGVAELQLLQSLGFVAMAVGNHEFDYGSAVLSLALSNAYGTGTLPLLSANLDLSAMPELAAWIQPSVMKDVAGLKVGIFGMTTPDDPMSQPAPVVIQGAGDPSVILGIAGAQTAALRGAGADVVICLSHLGLAYDQAIAANVPGIDVILGGHDHLLFDAPQTVSNAGGQTLIVHPGTFYRQIAKLQLSVDAGVVSLAGYEVIALDETVADDPAVAAVVASLKADVEAVYGDVYGTAVATASREIARTWDPARRERDTGMGNLIATALRARMGTQIAFTANGLISDVLYAGPLVEADLFRPVSYGYDTGTGYGYHIATLEITGAELLNALEVTLGYLDQTQDYFLQVAGMSFQYDPREPAGARVVPGSVRIGGAPLDVAAVYTATVNEGVAGLIPLLGVQVTNLQMRADTEYQALKDHVVSLGTVSSAPEGRIVDASIPVPPPDDDHDGGTCYVASAGGIGTGWMPAALAALLLLGARRARRES